MKVEWCGVGRLSDTNHSGRNKTFPAEIGTNVIIRLIGPITQLRSHAAVVTDRFALGNHPDVFQPRGFLCREM